LGWVGKANAGSAFREVKSGGFYTRLNFIPVDHELPFFSLGFDMEAMEAMEGNREDA